MDCQSSQAVFIMETSDCEDDPSDRADDVDDPLAVPIIKAEPGTEIFRNNSSNSTFPEDGGLGIVKRENIKSEVPDSQTQEDSMKIPTPEQSQTGVDNLFQELPTNDSEFPQVSDQSEFLQVSDQRESLINSHTEAIAENQNDLSSSDLNGSINTENETQIKLVEFHSPSGSLSSYRCTICNETFENVKLLTKHLVTHTNSTKPFQCPLCAKSVTTRQSLFNHLCIHTGWRPYSCDYCGKKFISKYNSVVHIREHEYSKNISCSMCNQHFESIEMFKVHNTVVHSLEHEFSKNIFCTVCNQHFGSIEMFKVHYSTCSPFGVSTMGTGMISTTDSNIKSTTDSNITNTSEPNVTNITETNTTDPNIVLPKVTGDDNSVQLQESLLQQKDGSNNYACAICHEVIGDLNELNKHLVTHSSTSPPYPCPICKRLFRRKYYLYNHIGLHCGNRCYSCPVCGKGFKDMNALNRHSRAVHNTRAGSANVHTGQMFINVPPLSQDSGVLYFCNNCSKYFPSSSAFESHICDHDQQAFGDITTHNTFQEQGMDSQSGEMETNQLQHISTGNEVHGLATTERQTQGIETGNRMSVGITTEMTVPSIEVAPTEMYIEGNTSTLTAQIQGITSLATEGPQIGESGIIQTPEGTCEEEESPVFCKIVDVYSEAVTESESLKITESERQTNTEQQMVERTGQQNHLFSPLPCPVCNAEFREVFELTEHIVSHVPSRPPYTCPVCNKLVMHKHNVYRHICLHTGYRPYNCTFCSRNFIQKRYLDRHLLLAHGQPPSDDIVSSLSNESQSQVQEEDIESENPTSFEQTVSNSIRNEEEKTESDDQIISDLEENTEPEIIEIEEEEETSSRNNQVDTVENDNQTISESDMTVEPDIIEIEEETDAETSKSNQNQQAESSNQGNCGTALNMEPEIEDEPATETPCSPKSNEEERGDKNVHMSLDLEVTMEPECSEIDKEIHRTLQSTANIPTPNSCSICEEVFKDNYFLNSHLLCHSSAISPFNCPLCKMSYVLRSDLENHLFLHTGIHSLGCHICGKSFLNTRLLFDHHREHAGLHSHNDCSNSSDPYNLQDEYAESGIMDSFQKSLDQSSSILRRVLIDGHSEKSNLSQSGSQVSRLVNSWSELQSGQADESDSDQESGEKQCFTVIDTDPNTLPHLLCNICGEKFENKQLLTKHLVEHSSTVGPHPCPACNKKFKSKLILEWHLSIHTGYEFPFSCRICKASFAQKELLKLHIEYNHNSVTDANEDNSVDKSVEKLPQEQNTPETGMNNCSMTIAYNAQGQQTSNSEILNQTIKCEIPSNDTMQVETVQKQHEQLFSTAIKEEPNKDQNNLVLCAVANYQPNLEVQNPENNFILIQPGMLNNVIATEPTGIGTLVSPQNPNELPQESTGIVIMEVNHIDQMPSNVSGTGERDISENVVGRVATSNFAKKDKKIDCMNINSSVKKHATGKKNTTISLEGQSLAQEKSVMNTETTGLESFEAVKIKVEQILENEASAEQQMDCRESLSLVNDELVNRNIMDSDMNNSHKCTSCGKMFIDEKLLWKHVRIKDRHAFSCNKLSRLRRKQTFQERKDWNLCKKAQRERDTYTNAKLGGDEENDMLQDSPRSQELEENEILQTSASLDDNEETSEEVCLEIPDDQIEKSIFESSKEKCDLFSVGKYDLNDFQCKICSKMFSNCEMLTKHLVSHASNLTCPLCSKRLHFKSCLTRHLCLHTGFRDFQCVFCDRYFTERERLAEHIYKHRFSCQMCLIPFKEEAELISHLEIKHEMSANDHTSEDISVISVIGQPSRDCDGSRSLGLKESIKLTV